MMISGRASPGGLADYVGIAWAMDESPCFGIAWAIDESPCLPSGLSGFLLTVGHGPIKGCSGMLRRCDLADRNAVACARCSSQR